jgi:hypothetical protein
MALSGKTHAMSDAHVPEPVKAKRSGCQWLVIIFASLIGLAGIAIVSFVAYLSFFYRKEKKLRPLTVLKDIQLTITSYETEYQHFPIPVSDRNGPDVTLRTRGPMLTALLGSEATPLNPKGIKFIDMPMAKDRKYGIWQDGEEWVLSDFWGEPYYIILDTNKDDQVPNPEFGTVITDPKLAQFYQKFPMPQLLPVRIAIYSSGKDRDPKTWQDNICSWRLH